MKKLISMVLMSLSFTAMADLTDISKKLVDLTETRLGFIKDDILNPFPPTSKTNLHVICKAIGVANGQLAAAEMIEIMQNGDANVELQSINGKLDQFSDCQGNFDGSAVYNTKSVISKIDEALKDLKKLRN